MTTSTLISIKNESVNSVLLLLHNLVTEVNIKPSTTFQLSSSVKEIIAYYKSRETSYLKVTLTDTIKSGTNIATTKPTTVVTSTASDNSKLITTDTIKEIETVVEPVVNTKIEERAVDQKKDEVIETTVVEPKSSDKTDVSPEDVDFNTYSLADLRKAADALKVASNKLKKEELVIALLNRNTVEAILAAIQA